LAWLAKALNEKIGGIVFDENHQRVFKPKPGDNGVLPFLKALQIDSDDNVAAENSPEIGPSSKANNSNQALLLSQLQRFNHLAPRGSLCFVISDFYAFGSEDEASETGFEKALYELSQRCDLNLLLIYDPFEAQALPEGRYRLSDGRALLEVNDSPLEQRQRHCNIFRNRLEKIAKLGKQAGFNAHAIPTDAPLLDVLNCQLSAVPGQTNFSDLLGDD
ncbi:MAG: hypothetical protein JKY01_06305, partial [Pseudomonadales bacterium]|nr:hypothetical protein [Pseudomonadales bacterium]